MMPGCRAAMRRRARPGPSGVTRSCSQFRRVCTLMPRALAKSFCVRQTKAPQRRHVAGEKPPAMMRFRCARVRARSRSSSVSSGRSAMTLLQELPVQSLFPVGRPPRADDPNHVARTLRPHYEHQAAPYRADRLEAILALAVHRTPREREPHGSPAVGRADAGWEGRCPCEMAFRAIHAFHSSRAVAVVIAPWHAHAPVAFDGVYGTRALALCRARRGARAMVAKGTPGRINTAPCSLTNIAVVFLFARHPGCQGSIPRPAVYFPSRVGLPARAQHQRASRDHTACIAGPPHVSFPRQSLA